jgi:hypothetical protein
MSEWYAAADAQVNLQASVLSLLGVYSASPSHEVGRVCGEFIRFQSKVFPAAT